MLSDNDWGCQHVKSVIPHMYVNVKATDRSENFPYNATTLKMPIRIRKW